MAQIQVILSEDVPSLGDAGDLVKVKPGYARNYLLPQGKAVLATAGKMQEIEHHKRLIAEKVAREMKTLQAQKNALEAVALEVQMQAGDEGKLFGSVTSAAIAGLLSEKGFEIDRRKIVLAEPIKELGEHAVPIKLRGELVAQVKLTVVAAA